MPRPRAARPELLRLAVRAALAAAALLAVARPGAPQASPAHDEALRALAEVELAQLATREGAAGPRELLLRNLSRYFAAYILPTDPEELGRLLGTLERMMDAAAREFHETASGLATTEGRARVERGDVARLLEDVLPGTPNPWGEVVFYPRAPAGDRIVVDAIDLQAFRDTGLVWRRLLARAAEPPRAGAPPLLPIATEAAPLYAEGLNAYGLLVLRLGGAVARTERAEALATHHLRQAGEALAARARAHLSGPGLPESAPLDAPAGSLFRDVTEAAGIRFRHVTADWLTRFRRYGPEAPTFSGGGVAAGDADGDGWDDLVFCGGRGCALYRNRRDGTFENVTAASGVALPGEARMPLLADFDNDGDRDLFLTYAAEGNRLLANVGGGRFVDATEASGLGRRGDISGPAVAFDADGDGLLDLYVANFGNYLAKENPWNPTDSRNGQPNRLYRNLGGLAFADVTAASGEGVGNTGWAQAVSHADVDGDGDQDLFVANDFGRDDLLLNQGDGTFRSAGRETGTDDPGHGMNVAFADLNRDSLPDVYVTNIWTWHDVRREVTETNSLFLSERRPDGTVGYRASADPDLLSHDTGWSWGALFLDVENDGDDDLFVANGFTDYLTFVQYRPFPDDPQRLYPINNGREPNVFFRNDGGLPNVVVEGSGTELAGLNSRGVATLDFDHDGDLDLAVSTFHAEAHLLRNEAAAPGSRWLEVELEGDPARGVPRDAFGARLEARHDALYVWRTLAGGEGFSSQSAHMLHLGLGEASEVDLEIVWPGGERQRLAGVAANQRIRVRQGREGFEVLPSQAP
jgi:hypothetical protein